MTDFPAEKQERIQELLAKQHQLILSFLEATKKQQEILSVEDLNADDFLANIERRQTIIGEAEAFRGEMERLLDDYLSRPAAGEEDEKQRRAILAAREETRARLREIQELDQQNQAKAKERLDFFRGRREHATQTKKGVTAYAKSGEFISGGEFFDEQK